MQHIRNITTAPTRLLSIFCGLALATAAFAAEPHFGNPVFTADADSKLSKEEFATDTPKIYLHVQLEDVTQGTKLTASWIAEKTDAAPALSKPTRPRTSSKPPAAKAGKGSKAAAQAERAATSRTTPPRSTSR